MKTTPYEKVPLNADDKELLLTIYRKRLKMVAIVYTVLIIFGLMVSPDGIDSRSTRWEDKPDAKYVSRTGMLLINILWIESIIIGTGAFYLFRKVMPFKKDADSGMKDKVPFQVIRKEYFVLTGEFYVALNDPDCLHHQIDEETYHNLWEGCTIYLYRGSRSKYVFEENGRFTL